MNLDVAILTLCDELSFTRGVSPICLPSKESSEYDHVEAIVSGWGKLEHGGKSPDVLHSVEVSTITNRRCRRSYRNSEITKNMICARAPGKDSCQEDSGGNA